VRFSAVAAAASKRRTPPLPLVTYGTQKTPRKKKDDVREPGLIDKNRIAASKVDIYN
jgi:hypothetical protein